MFTQGRHISSVQLKQSRSSCGVSTLVAENLSSQLTTVCRSIVDAEIDIHTAYFDEAHNSVKRNFFAPTEQLSQSNSRAFFFTATPKYSSTVFKPGMNMPEIYGNTICNVPAPELVEGGYILPPKVVVKRDGNGRQRYSTMIVTLIIC